MKKNDKLIVILGVIILVLSSIGIYYWVEEVEEETATMDDVLSSFGHMKYDLPDAIQVTDENPFYALAATPLAVHYDNEGGQKVIPLYVTNLTNPSDTVERTQEDQLDMYDITKLNTKLNYDDAKEFSLEVAKKYWDSSKTVLLIKDNEEGYDLGVVAAPMASYLSIPIIVTDKVDSEVEQVLEDLDVEISVVCGDLEGYGKTFELNDIDEIIDLTVELIGQKFNQDVEYITLTNPRDAFPPKVLNSTLESCSGNLLVSNLLPSTITAMFKPGSPITFTIPEDYEYAHVVLEIINQEPGEDIEKFGDNIMLSGELTGYILSTASPPIVDEAGNIVHDRLRYEDTFYDMGGHEFSFVPFANVLTGDIPAYIATVTIEQLENPYQPLLKQASSLAPYLTAYHKGIVFAKTDFAFANDREVKLNGENLPGTTTPRNNAILIPKINEHVYEKIHKPLNQLLAKLSDINISSSAEALRNYCLKEPYYIALVGDATMLPQYFYRSPHSNPFDNPFGSYGTNTPSDFIYGNIDPSMYSLTKYTDNYLEEDEFSEGEVKHPVMENIVGRIIGGFDVQDTSALLARTIFYDDIMKYSVSEEWKESALVMSGAGLEFQAIPGIDWFYKARRIDEPAKWASGQQHFLSVRTQNFMENYGGFTVEKLERGQAQSTGFSKEALDDIKTANLLSKLLFTKREVQFIQGLENIQSLFSREWWSMAFDSESGIHGAESQENSNLIQVNAHGIYFDYSPGDVNMYASGGPGWQFLSRILFPACPNIPTPRSGLENKGGFSVRDVSLMEMGPSLMFVECCGGGKIDSLSPSNTLSAAYQHAGVNAFICPSTLSAIGGYLEPRPIRKGWGLLGYFSTLMNTRNGEYTETEFCGWMFEHTYQELFDNDATIGEALRNARNSFLPDQFYETYLWTPPLDTDETGTYAQPAYMKSTAKGASNVPVEKYAAVFQLNLLGDPMWNPWQPVNEGS